MGQLGCAVNTGHSPDSSVVTVSAVKPEDLISGRQRLSLLSDWLFWLRSPSPDPSTEHRVFVAKFNWRGEKVAIRLKALLRFRMFQAIPALDGSNPDVFMG
jgi:hypothetical protein